MWEYLLADAPPFELFSSAHFVPLIVSGVIGSLSIVVARFLFSDRTKWLFGAYVSAIIPILLIGWIIIRISQGLFDPKIDLPFHLCHFLAFFLPFFFYYEYKKGLRVIYFFIMAGTIQALITPDLSGANSNYIVIRYWIMHAGIVVLSLYSLIAFRLRPGWRDIWHAMVGVNIYLVFCLIINLIFDSNYFYVSHKPPVASMLDALGEWPWYILQGEFLVLFLFIILLLPFLFLDRWKLLTIPKT